MGKRERSRGKEKLIGTIAGVTAIAAPLMMPVQVSYAKQDPIPTVVDKIQTIVIPKDGTKYIDFYALYNADYINVVVNEGQSSEQPVSGAFTSAYDDIYEIKANELGTATFTITGERNEGEYVTITDTFKVIVVENSGDPDAYKFDISSATNLVGQSTYTKDQVTDLLKNISPISLNNYDPIMYNDFNTAPTQIFSSSSILSGKLGVPIYSWEIQDEIVNQFEDPDIDEETNGEGCLEGCEEPGWSGISLVSIEENEDFSVIKDYNDGGRIQDYKITPLHVGDVNLDVVVTDHDGGFTKGHIPIHIDPIYKPDSVLVNHFQSPGLEHPVLYLSNDALINLNEIFFDSTNHTLNYSLFVEYQAGTSDYRDKTIDIDNSSFTWNSLYQQPNITKIKEIRAYEYVGSEKMLVAALPVDIERTTKDPFPASINLYQSIEGVGTSSFILNYRSDKGFNDSSITITDSDLQNTATGRVTASVYDDTYLKFDAGYGETTWTTSMKVYAHDSDPSHLYLDDFNFNLVSASQTTTIAMSPVRPAIRINRLYPTYQYDYEFWNNFTANEYVTLNTPANVFIGFDSGSLIATYNSGVPYGTTDILKFDPFGGKSVFYVPFKNNGLPQ